MNIPQLYTAHRFRITLALLPRKQGKQPDQKTVTSVSGLWSNQAKANSAAFDRLWKVGERVLTKTFWKKIGKKWSGRRLFGLSIKTMQWMAVTSAWHAECMQTFLWVKPMQLCGHSVPVLASTCLCCTESEFRNPVTRKMWCLRLTWIYFLRQTSANPTDILNHYGGGILNHTDAFFGILMDRIQRPKPSSCE